jgi:hypothetical protein
VLWDDEGHAPPLKTNADWIKAGEIVFDAPISFDRVVTVPVLRDPKQLRRQVNNTFGFSFRKHGDRT